MFIVGYAGGMLELRITKLSDGMFQVEYWVYDNGERFIPDSGRPTEPRCTEHEMWHLVKNEVAV